MRKPSRVTTRSRFRGHTTYVDAFRGILYPAINGRPISRQSNDPREGTKGSKRAGLLFASIPNEFVTSQENVNLCEMNPRLS